MAHPGPIGVFDSGFGGLTVLAEFLKVLPGYDYLYLADAARVPYGDRDPDEILAFSEQSVRWLFDQGCGLVIIACNTATAFAIRPLQQKVFPDRKILGVTIPAAERVAASGWKKVGVLATSKTVQDRTYGKRIRLLDSSVEVCEVECPALVPLLEDGKVADGETLGALRGYVAALPSDIDALVLGCTHYHVLQEAARSLVSCPVVNPGAESAAALAAYLARRPDVTTLLSRGTSRVFATTGDPEKFARLAPLFLGAPTPSVQKIALAPAKTRAA